MAKQFDALGIFGEWSARPVQGITRGAEGDPHPMDDDHLAAPVELFEDWDQKPRGPDALTCTEEDPAVEMLAMGLRDAD